MAADGRFPICCAPPSHRCCYSISSDRPAYFASPWITDFDLFDNRFRDYAALFPRLADEPWIRFSHYLAKLSTKLDVRLLTTDNDRSGAFMSLPTLRASPRIACRLGDSKFHEKGILAPTFYIEGSMNITHHGVRVRGEKDRVSQRHWCRPGDIIFGVHGDRHPLRDRDRAVAAPGMPPGTPAGQCR
ncbi:hypothetical protein ACFSTD_03490 [Novosphingobium colocasiae]